MNKEFKKKYSRLFKCYDRELRALQKRDVAELNNPLDYFVTYIKFMRDYYILTEPIEKDGAENKKIAIIASTLSEYEQYVDCEKKYFRVGENGVVKRIVPGTQDEVLSKYNAEKAFHWNCFWQLVCLNMSDWMDKDAAI